MYIKSIRRLPTLNRAGRVNMNVSNITLRLFYFLRSLNTLTSLRVLITVVADPPFISSKF